MNLHSRQIDKALYSDGWFVACISAMVIMAFIGMPAAFFHWEQTHSTEAMFGLVITMSIFWSYPMYLLFRGFVHLVKKISEVD